MYQEDDGTLIMQEGDQCLDCTHLWECPVIGGLNHKVFWLDMAVRVDQCQFFKGKDRHLKVVPHE